MKKLFVVFSIVFLFIISDSFVIYNNIQNFQREKELLTTSLINQATTLYNMMATTREWAGEHNGIYVRGSKLKPNKYLQNNTLRTDKNETLVWINPAWMTRQISEFSNQSRGYLYKITSLQPLNPQNSANDFEREALLHLEKNADKKYYYNLPDYSFQEKYFNFMGALKVKESCLNCHNGSLNDVGKVQGGIRVSVPIEVYRDSYENSFEYKKNNIWVVLVFSFISCIVLIFFVLNIMHHKEKIKALNFSLKKKVKKRTHELDQLNESLELQVQESLEKLLEKEKLMISQAKYAAMGNMISVIAHQWRQPLSEVIMINNNLMAEILLGGDDKNAMKKNIEDCYEVIEHLSKTIDDFANFFQPTKSKEDVHLSILVQDTLRMLSNVIQKNRISVTVQESEDIIVYTHKRELLHVLLNIITNATDAFIQNSKEGKKSKIDITVSKTQDAIFIKICDNAGGIPMENIERVFEPYFSTKSQNGTGLGLYISKIIIDKHLSGSIVATNVKEGVCFEIMLPYAQEGM